MKWLTIYLPLFLLPFAVATAVAADTGTERKVRVALALAGAAQCGECRFDEAGCRAEAEKTGRPLVLLVGSGCERAGAAVRQVGGIPCVVPSYDGDGQAATDRRAVVLVPKPTGGFWLDRTVPMEAGAVTAAVLGVKSPAPKKLDWDLGPAADRR